MNHSFVPLAVRFSGTGPVVLVALALMGLLACQSRSPQAPGPSAASADTSSQVPPPPSPSPHPYWNDLARLIAGLPPRDTLYWRPALTDTAWKAHARRMEYLWSVRHTHLFTPLETWAKTELYPYHDWKGIVFYPFSGADWPSIRAIFPHGSRYVFFGLEQEGDPHYVCLLQPVEIARNLWGPYAAMADLLRLSFFKTKEMQQFLVSGKVRGLLPVFLAFFARTGHDIYQVEHIYLTAGGRIDTLPSGRPKPPQSPWDTLVTGLRFLVGKPDQPPQEVIYVSFNASNQGLTRQRGILPFLNTLQPCVSFIKAASYLLHGPEFSQMRTLLLTQSLAILQEDSGIPYRFFDSKAWKVQLYGVYHAPIPLFRSKFQPNLYQAYRTQPVRPIAFGIGYHLVPGTSNLLWAVRRDPKTPLSLPAETLSVQAAPLSPLPPAPQIPPVSAPSLSDSSALPASSLPDTPLPRPKDTVPTEAPSADSE